MKKIILVLVLLLTFLFDSTCYANILHEAIKKGNLDQVKELIKNNPKFVNFKDKNGETPLHITIKDAPEKNQIEIIEVLIKNGANVNMYNTSGWVPLHEAVSFDKAEIVKLLIKNKANTRAKTKKVYSGYMFSVSKGTSVWKLAIERNSVSAVLELINNDKSSINWRDISDNSPLDYAAIYGRDAIAKKLILAKAYVNAKGKYLVTALYKASNPSVANVLIKNGAEVNIKDYKGRTPLHIAARENIVAVVKLLIENDAKVNAKDKFGQTPLHYATNKDQSEERAPDRNSEPVTISTKDVIKTLIEKGAEVNIKDKYGRTPLHRAALLGNVTAIKELLANGANTKIKDKKGRTPLKLAIIKKRRKVIKLLRAPKTK